MKRLLLFWGTIVGLIIIVGIYYSSGYFLIYNNDAYVDADLVNIATTVSGSIATIDVHDNQLVKKGTRLIQLLQRPFTINVNLAQSILDSAVAQKALLAVQIKQANVNIVLKTDQFNLAKREWGRFQALQTTQAVSKETLDQKHATYQVAQQVLAKAQLAEQLVEKQYVIATTKIDQKRHQLELRQYERAQSVITAPSEGIVNHLRLYRGDTIKADETLFGFIDNKSWRIVANIKESNLIKLHVGKPVWIYLSSRPWHLYRGRIESIGRGVARQAQPTNAALPYIEPVTNWIRYDYRLPVRIHLVNFPSTVQLHMGTNARAIILL